MEWKRLLNDHSKRRCRLGDLLIAVLTGVALLLCGCSGKEGEEAQKAIRVAGRLAEMRPALNALSSIERYLAVECAKRQGVTAQAPARTPEPDQAAIDGTLSPKPSVAARLGYGLFPGPLNMPTAHGLAEWKKLSDKGKQRMTTIMFGNPDTKVIVAFDDGYTAEVGSTGCFAEAQRTIYGDLKVYAERSWISSRAYGRSVGALEKSKEWTTTVSLWSQCMTTAGHSFKTPGAAHDWMMRRYNGVSATSKNFSDLRRQEFDLAAADAQCSDNVGLADIWATTVAAADSQYLIRHAPTIEAWADLLEQRAPELIAEVGLG